MFEKDWNFQNVKNKFFFLVFRAFFENRVSHEKKQYNIKDAPCLDLQLLFDIFFYVINNLEDIIENLLCELLNNYLNKLKLYTHFFFF